MISGGSGSGKSAYAEECIVRMSQGCSRYYLATMQVYGEEGRKKVERHREMRKEKGFVTIEQQTRLEDAVSQIENPGKSSVLLECMSNLTANEIYQEDGAGDNTVKAILNGIHHLLEQVAEEIVAERILHGVAMLKGQVEHLVIVTNNVFEDGIVYEESTVKYIRAMGRINEKLAEQADRVVEVVVGIPVIVKEG